MTKTAHVIVVGNEKGGAGKSTVSMHVSTAVARMGFKVALLDLDLRQQSLGRFIENRRVFADKNNLTLAMPVFVPLPEIDQASLAPGEHINDRRLMAALDSVKDSYDFVLIDCPGSHTRLSQLAHAQADTLITPLNDSFVDFDMLARVADEGSKVLGPSVYSEMVWSARQLRAKQGQDPMDWIVLRNRLGSQAMINKAKMQTAVENLAKRIGFRVAPGFSERVVFRELFPRGLTLLDLRDVGGRQLSISNIAARQEVRELMKALQLPGVTVNF